MNKLYYGDNLKVLPKFIRDELPIAFINGRIYFANRRVGCAPDATIGDSRLFGQSRRD